MNKPNSTFEKVKSIEVGKPKSLSQILHEMSNTGFQGKKLAEACNAFVQMIEERELSILLGYSGSLSVAGQWKIITWLLENKYIIHCTSRSIF